MNPTPEQISKLPKWAQAHIKELQDRVTHLEGLPETTDTIPPDLPPPANGNPFGTLTRGWEFNIHFLKSATWGLGSAVNKACSSFCYHGDSWVKTTSQGSRSLYSTERLAWQAAKAEFVKWASSVVAEVDKRISKASDKPYKP